MTSIKEQLDRMAKHCLTLHGTTIQEIEENGEKKIVQVPRDAVVREFLKTLASDSAQSSKEMAEKMIAAWDDQTGNLQKALNATRVEAVSNFIVSESTFRSAYFATETLGPADEPFYTNETGNEVRIGSLGEDGVPEQVRVVHSQARTPIGLFYIASDKVRYKIMDIMRGDVTQSQLKTIDIARDLRIKLDRIHYNLLIATVANGGCFGAFSTEQARSNKSTRIYLPHSVIDTSHLPTTNDIVNGAANGGTAGTRFTVRYYDPPKDSAGSATSYLGLRPAVLLAVLDYCTSWGDVLPGGGRLNPTGEIIVPASDIINFALTQLPVTNLVENNVQEQIATNGYFSVSLFGRNWKFIPDVTIPAGTCFPRLNLLPGITYEKPSMDREFTKRDDELNFEERYQKKVYGAVIPSQWRPRAMRVKYIA